MRVLGLLLILPVCSALIVPAEAHEVVMNDGTRHEGEIVENDEATVVIETTFDGKKVLDRANVKSLDTSTPPLRHQFAFRASEAKGDGSKLWGLHKWARSKGFKDELTEILEAIVALNPKDARARKKLGHKKVDGRWMSSEEEQRYLVEKQTEEMKAKGFVLYEGKWVSKEEKEAREKGLIKDGDDWVTEAEWHKRRGEIFVDGKWIRLGEEAGKAYHKELVGATRLKVSYTWGPHFDVYSESQRKTTKRVLDAAEKGYAEMRRVLQPAGEDYPEDERERIQIALFKKAPAYVRFSKWFNEREKCEELVPSWLRAVQRQHSFWWTHPAKMVAVYQFPNTDKTFASNVLHNLGLVMLTRYKINFLYPSVWLQEGFAYYVEMKTQGYTLSFTLGKGSASAGEKGPVWADSKKWKSGLKKLVADGRDPPLKRIARMTQDQFSYVELVKSWSLIDFLIQWDAGKFKQFIDLSKERGPTGEPALEEDALKTAYGVGYRQLD